MRKPRLTDVELSKILSLSAIGGLDHQTYYNPSGPTNCVAGAAYDMGVDDWWELASIPRAGAISMLASPRKHRDYGGTPTKVLRYLERRGLA